MYVRAGVCDSITTHLNIKQLAKASSASFSGALTVTDAVQACSPTFELAVYLTMYSKIFKVYLNWCLISDSKVIYPSFTTFQ